MFVYIVNADITYGKINVLDSSLERLKNDLQNLFFYNFIDYQTKTNHT